MDSQYWKVDRRRLRGQYLACFVLFWFVCSVITWQQESFGIQVRIEGKKEQEKRGREEGKGK